LSGFDPKPKVDGNPVDLLKLYKAVMQRGGYDRVSEIKVEFKNIGQELGLNVSNSASLNWSIKSAYYYNLA
jgi:chromatin structure-remodeling complex subunit RSC9